MTGFSTKLPLISASSAAFPHNTHTHEQYLHTHQTGIELPRAFLTSRMLNCGGRHELIALEFSGGGIRMVGFFAAAGKSSQSRVPTLILLLRRDWWGLAPRLVTDR